MEKPAIALSEHFADLDDPRIDRTKLHLLLDIVIIAICAVICGADTWVEIEEFGKAKINWLHTFLELPNGIPSHDTFGRVFARLDPDQFRLCFANWVQTICQVTNGEVVALDGKALRRSHDHRLGKDAIYMVGAWASANRLVLGQVKVDDKSNEITAIPELLRLLTLEGCIVTIDAMGCQTKIAQQIIDENADYVLALKGNQGTLCRDVQDLFAYAQEIGRTPLNRGEHQETRFGLETGVVAALFKRVKAQRGLESASTSPTTVKCGATAWSPSAQNRVFDAASKTPSPANA